jgi:hypothetical protein
MRPRPAARLFSSAALSNASNLAKVATWHRYKSGSIFDDADWIWSIPLITENGRMRIRVYNYRFFGTDPAENLLAPCLIKQI